MINMSVEKGKRTFINYRRSVTRRLSPEMELSEERYFRLNRILLSMIGLWPYDNSRYRQILSTLIMLLFSSYIFIEVYASLQCMYICITRFTPGLLTFRNKPIFSYVYINIKGEVCCNILKIRYFRNFF